MRVPLLSPMSVIQETIVTLLARGHNNADIAERLFMHPEMVKYHVKHAAKKVPGDLPAQMRLVAWARGASEAVLTTQFLEAYPLGK